MVHRRASSNARILRILKIYQRLLNGAVCNARLLAGEFQVDERTVKRDIDLLRDLPLFIDYDHKKKSYCLVSQQNHRNGNGLYSPQETMLLLTGLWVLQQIPSGIDESLVEKLKLRLLTNLNEAERAALHFQCISIWGDCQEDEQWHSEKIA